MIGGRGLLRNGWCVVVALVAGLEISACAPAPVTSTARTEPARLESIEGSDLKRVILTGRAAERIGLQTAPVAEALAARTRRVGGAVADFSGLPADVRAALADRVDRGSSASPGVSPDQLPLLVDERFADNTRGWPDDPLSTAWMEPAGGYHLFARDPGRFVAVGVPGITAPLADVMVSGRFRKTGGPPGGGYGLIVRDQDPGGRDGLDQGGRYYVFEVSDTGKLGLWLREVDHWVDLLPWTESDAVRPGPVDNDLAVMAAGGTLTFLVNAVPVGRQPDTLRRGGVGVFAGGDGAEVLVEQLAVRAPDDRAPAAAGGGTGEMWVRVPLSPSELSRVDRARGVIVLPLARAGDPAAGTLLAAAASRPTEIDSALYYPLAGQPDGLAPGQRVLVQLTLAGGQRKVVPHSAVLYDTRGATWVYTRVEPLTFVRHPVSIDFVEGEQAFLLEGPPVGADVVTVGATELLGTEFKFSK